jgi:hypothetical protein
LAKDFPFDFTRLPDGPFFFDPFLKGSLKRLSRFCWGRSPLVFWPDAGMRIIKQRITNPALIRDGKRLPAVCSLFKVKKWLRKQER